MRFFSSYRIPLSLSQYVARFLRTFLHSFKNNKIQSRRKVEIPQLLGSVGFLLNSSNYELLLIIGDIKYFQSFISSLLLTVLLLLDTDFSSAEINYIIEFYKPLLFGKSESKGSNLGSFNT